MLCTVYSCRLEFMLFLGGMFSTQFVRRILSLQFDDDNAQFVIAFSWQWQIIVVDCCFGIAVVVDYRSLIVLFFPFVVDIVPCNPVG